jgi:hypothetical protein
MEDENLDVRRIAWGSILSIAKMALLATRQTQMTGPTSVDERASEMMTFYTKQFPGDMTGVVR